MSLREKLATGMRIGTAMGVMYFSGDLQAKENDHGGVTPVMTEQMKQDGDYSVLIQKNTPDDQIKLQKIIDMMAATKTGKSLLDFLRVNGTTIEFNVPLAESAVASYQKETNSIEIRRDLFKDALPLLWIFSHEAEHARHITIEDQKGYSAHSSLNDSYIATTMHEALAERSGCSVVLEYLAEHPNLRSSLPNNFSFSKKNLDDPQVRIEALKEMIYNLDLEQRNGKSILEIAGEVFDRRMAVDKTPGWDTTWKRYEKHAYINSDDAPSKSMSDWNKIVSDISLGQVSEIKDLPVISSSFARRCISSEIKKNPNASSLSELDLSCLQKNKIQLDENDTRNMVISSLFEAQAQQGISPELSGKITNFLGVELSDNLKEKMGWTDCFHDKEYIEKTNLAMKNLEKYSAKDCLNKMTTLFNTQEGQNFLEQQGENSEISCNLKTAEFMKEFSSSSLSPNLIKMIKANRVK